MFEQAGVCHGIVRSADQRRKMVYVCVKVCVCLCPPDLLICAHARSAD